MSNVSKCILDQKRLSRSTWSRQSQDHGEGPTERSNSNAEVDKRETAGLCPYNKVIVEDVLFRLGLS